MSWLSSLRSKRRLKLALRSVGRDDICIDCGANVGDYTELMASTGARVYAFEPNPRAFHILSRRFRGLPTVQCFNQVVMDRDCVLSLNVPCAHGPWDAIDTTVSSSFIRGEHDSSEFEMRQVDIACINLGMFIRSLRL